MSRARTPLPRPATFGENTRKAVSTLVLGQALFFGMSCAPASPTRPSKEEPAQEQPSPRQKLIEQVLQLSQLSQLKPVEAAAQLGSSLGEERPDEYRTDWSILPAEGIIEGNFSSGTDGWRLVEIVPRPSLALAFEDLVPRLLDRPFDVDPVWSHEPEYPLAETLIRFQYSFEVPAGELIMRVPVSLPKGVPYGPAMHEGYLAAKGRSVRRSLVGEILITSERSQEWDRLPTLRQYRAGLPRQSPPK